MGLGMYGLTGPASGCWPCIGLASVWTHLVCLLPSYNSSRVFFGLSWARLLQDMYMCMRQISSAWHGLTGLVDLHEGTVLYERVVVHESNGLRLACCIGEYRYQS